MTSRYLTAALALFYLANGLRMLWDPASWYAAIPGIEATGPLNPHFVRDIAFSYVVAAAAGGVAVWRWAQAAPWLIAAAAWPALHGVAHVAEWIAHGVPPTAAFIAEGGGVVLPALLGAVIAIHVARNPSH